MIDEKLLLKQMDKTFKEKHGQVSDTLAEGFMQMDKLIREQPKLENTEDFKHFTMYNDSTLKSMRKDDLIDYIHTIYFYWKNCDIQLENKIKINNRLYNKLVKIHKNPPLKIDELKPNIVVYDNEIKELVKIVEVLKDINIIRYCTFGNDVVGAGEFREGCYYRFEVKDDEM